jgi:hypothetical protein
VGFKDEEEEEEYATRGPAVKHKKQRARQVKDLYGGDELQFE